MVVNDVSHTVKLEGILEMVAVNYDSQEDNQQATSRLNPEQ
jgi:hypothetical protein